MRSLAENIIVYMYYMYLGYSMYLFSDVDSLNSDSNSWFKTLIQIFLCIISQKYKHESPCSFFNIKIY